MRKLQFLIGAVAMALAGASGASAAIQLTLSSGGTTIVVNDQDFVPVLPATNIDSNPAAGQVTYIGSIGNWTLNVSTGTVGTNPLIDLNSVNTYNTTGGNPGPLTITFSATDYNGPVGFGFDSHIGGTLANGHSLTYQGYFDPGNGLNSQNTAIGNLLQFGPGGAFSNGAGGVQVVPAGNYSLTQIVTISANANGTSSFNAAINVTPEPASVVLLSGVLVAVVAGLRRKARAA